MLSLSLSEELARRVLENLREKVELWNFFARNKILCELLHNYSKGKNTLKRLSLMIRSFCKSFL